MDLEALRLFVAVADEGSLQGAANAGAGSRTTLRRKIDELEASIGVPLFERGSTGVELTEAGAVLHLRASQLIAEANVLAQTTREVGLKLKRPIRLAVPVGIPAVGPIQAMSLLRSLWPEARIQFVTTLDFSQPDPREADLYVTMTASPPPHGFRVFRLGAVEIQLIASPQLLEEHGPIETVEDLSKHTILAWRESGKPAPTALPGRRGEEIPFEPDFVSDEIDQLHQMVALGAGVALVPHINMTPEDEENYVRVLEDLVGAQRVIRLLVARAVADSPIIRSLTEFLDQFINPAFAEEE